MKLLSFRECLKRGKQAIEEALIPIRVEQAKSKGRMEQLKIDEKLIGLDVKLQELVSEKEIPFDKIIETIDEIELLQRRKKQFDMIIEQLFPNESVEELAKEMAKVAQAKRKGDEPECRPSAE